MQLHHRIARRCHRGKHINNDQQRIRGKERIRALRGAEKKMKNRCRSPSANSNEGEFRLSINPLSGSLPPSSLPTSSHPVERMTPSKRECHSLAFAAAFSVSSFKEWPSH